MTPESLIKQALKSIDHAEGDTGSYTHAEFIAYHFGRAAIYALCAIALAVAENKTVYKG